MLKQRICKNTARPPPEWIAARAREAELRKKKEDSDERRKILKAKRRPPSPLNLREVKWTTLPSELSAANVQPDQQQQQQQQQQSPVNDLKEATKTPDPEKCVFIHETRELYEQFNEPYINRRHRANARRREWIDDFLGRDADPDRVVMSDPDHNSGFVLILMKPKEEEEKKEVTLMALCRRRDIRTLRDLRGEHLDLLRKIWSKGTRIVREKFGDGKRDVRAFVPYLPEFYHFHVYFKLVDPATYSFTDRDHLLSTVIYNISINDLYYKEVHLIYPSYIPSLKHEYLKQVEEEIQNKRKWEEGGNIPTALDEGSRDPRWRTKVKEIFDCRVVNDLAKSKERITFFVEWSGLNLIGWAEYDQIKDNCTEAMETFIKEKLEYQPRVGLFMRIPDLKKYYKT